MRKQICAPIPIVRVSVTNLCWLQVFQTLMDKSLGDAVLAVAEIGGRIGKSETEITYYSTLHESQNFTENLKSCAQIICFGCLILLWHVKLCGLESQLGSNMFFSVLTEATFIAIFLILPWNFPSSRLKFPSSQVEQQALGCYECKHAHYFKYILG